MTRIDRRPLTGRRFWLAIGSGLSAMALSAAIVASGAGRDAFVAGQVGSRAVGLDDTGRARAIDRATEVRRALDLPDGARQAAVRFEDRFEGGLVDEVTALDSADQPVSVVRLDPGGVLRSAVRLGWSTATGDLSEAAAAGRAGRLARSVGLSARLGIPATVDRAAHGWAVHWSRLVGGAVVLGDGTTVRLWVDGSLHSLSTLESALATAPVDSLSGPEASAIVRAAVDGWGLSGVLGEPTLAWVAPNDLFEPARPDAPEAVRRLAWLVRVTPTGDVASRLRALEVHVDAGDGRLLGGDVLE